MIECVLVMPAYNEAACIRQVVGEWNSEFAKRFGDAYQLIVVNDGSKDQTGAHLDESARQNARLTVVHQSNAGHGAALLRAYREAANLPVRYVFHVDSDAQFLPKDFIRLWDKREVSSFILGFRAQRNDPLPRLIITRLLRCLLFALYGVWIPDSNVPFRLIKKSYLAGLLDVLPPEIFAPNIFLSVLAAKDGQSVQSIPITHEERKTGTVSILRWKLLQVCLRSARELIAFRWTLKDRVRRLHRRLTPEVTMS